MDFIRHSRENKASIALAKKHGFKEATKDEYYKKYSSGWDKYTTLKYGRGVNKNG